MKTKLFLMAMLTVVAVGCSKIDGPASENDNATTTKPTPDPEGTVSMNMLNNYNTYLDDNIKIDGANNFTSSYNDGYFLDLGEMNGLGNIVDYKTTGLADKCAVTPGHGYLACRKYHTFPSGEVAVCIDSDYLYNGTVYRIYVEEWILSGAYTIIGAKIKYQAPFVPSKYNILPHSKSELYASPDFDKFEIETDSYIDGWSKEHNAYYVRYGAAYTYFYEDV